MIRFHVFHYLRPRAPLASAETHRGALTAMRTLYADSLEGGESKERLRFTLVELGEGGGESTVGEWVVGRGGAQLVRTLASRDAELWLAAALETLEPLERAPYVLPRAAALLEQAVELLRPLRADVREVDWLFAHAGSPEHAADVVRELADALAAGAHAR